MRGISWEPFGHKKNVEQVFVILYSIFNMLWSINPVFSFFFGFFFDTHQLHTWLMPLDFSIDRIKIICNCGYMKFTFLAVSSQSYMPPSVHDCFCSCYITDAVQNTTVFIDIFLYLLLFIVSLQLSPTGHVSRCLILL